MPVILHSSPAKNTNTISERLCVRASQAVLKPWGGGNIFLAKASPVSRKGGKRGWLFPPKTHRIEPPLLGRFRIKVLEHVRPCCCVRKFVSSDLRHEIRRVAHEGCHGRKTLARLRKHFWAAHPEKAEQDVRVRAYQHRTGSQAPSMDYHMDR